jgi:hypothetical protein
MLAVEFWDDFDEWGGWGGPELLMMEGSQLKLHFVIVSEIPSRIGTNGGYWRGITMTFAGRKRSAWLTCERYRLCGRK